MNEISKGCWEATLKGYPPLVCSFEGGGRGGRGCTEVEQQT